MRLTYRFGASDRPGAERRAREIAREQTVELPEECLSPEIAERVVGTVESVEPVAGHDWSATVSYDPALTGGELPQLFNLVLGNLSLLEEIRVDDLVLPPALLDRFAGPRFGIPGLRALCAVEERRPLLCAPLKPLGASPAELAERCADFASAGIDLIKDDHGLADQATAPFRERVARCAAAVRRANAKSGRQSLYLPHVSGPADEISARAELALEQGCRGVLVSPLLVGLDQPRFLAERFSLAVLSHPALAGAYFGERHGIRPHLLLGRLFRLAGSDGVIFPDAGGRFPFSRTVCDAIQAALREPLGSIRPSFPVPAGGIELSRMPRPLGVYGADTIFLIGGSLYREADPARAIEKLLRLFRDAGA